MESPVDEGDRSALWVMGECDIADNEISLPQPREARIAFGDLREHGPIFTRRCRGLGRFLNTAPTGHDARSFMIPGDPMASIFKGNCWCPRQGRFGNVFTCHGAPLRRSAISPYHSRILMPCGARLGTKKRRVPRKRPKFPKDLLGVLLRIARKKATKRRLAPGIQHGRVVRAK
jgi:hypothetical protein